jgi:hypothetical protein
LVAVEQPVLVVPLVQPVVMVVLVVTRHLDHF